jgi:hypothetical protein
MKAHALVLAAFLVAPLAAYAQQAQPDAVQEQKAHFKRGLELYDKGDHANALEEFRAAYAAKASPSIKRNIALCLRALGRYAEATDALEEMLAEGDTTLKPEVKDGARRTIAEMSGQVANARLRVVYGGRAAPPTVAVTIDDRDVPLAKLAAPIHVAPGDHVFRARAQGFYDAEQKRPLVAGQTADLELALVAIEIAARGRLVIRTNVQSSAVAIDGIGVGTGGWTGDIPVGRHHVEVTAAGYRAHAFDVDVIANQPRDLSIDMTSNSAVDIDVPPPYEVPTQPQHPQRNWYLLGGLSLYGETLTFTDAARDTGTRRDVGGGGVVAHAGRRISPYLSLGVLGEIGAMTAKSYSSTNPPDDQTVDVSLVMWTLAPELRVHTKGKLRAIGGVALGLEGMFVKEKLSSSNPFATNGGTAPVTGSGVSGMGMVEGGAQLELGRLLLEAALFVDAHGVGAPRGDNGRFFADSPAARAGLRALVGYTF